MGAQTPFQVRATEQMIPKLTLGTKIREQTPLLRNDDCIVRQHRNVLLNMLSLENRLKIERQPNLLAVLIAQDIDFAPLSVISDSATRSERLQDRHRPYQRNRPFPPDCANQIDTPA